MYYIYGHHINDNYILIFLVPFGSLMQIDSIYLINELEHSLSL
jgi:hypothetical protein